ncbi:Gag-like protein, partial [Operophtera brumata]
MEKEKEMEKVKEMEKEKCDKGAASPVLMGSRSLSIGSNLSIMSAESTGSRSESSKFWHSSRKRDREELSARSRSGSGDASERSPAAKVRGRGRPPTTGHYVGLAQAKRELVTAQRAQMELEAEQEVARMSQYLRADREERMSKSSAGKKDCQQLDDVTSADIVKRVADSVELIDQVAKKSRNLKGTFVRTLKDAACCIKEAVEVLQSRNTSDETRILQVDNARLQKEVAELKKEMADIRAQMVQMSFDTSSEKKKDTCVSQEELTQTIMLQGGGMVNARLEAMQDRLLPEKRARPPLAADRRNAEASATFSVTPVVEPGPSRANIEKPLAEPNQSKSATKRRGRKSNETIPVTPVPSEPLLPALTPMNEEWTMVARRGLRRKETTIPASWPQQVQSQTALRQQRRPRRGRKRVVSRFRPPRSSAVVITLKPGSEEKGVSYASALAEAKTKVDLASLGIPALRFRTAATGARILEVPGTTSGEMADSLAQKLKEVFNEEDIQVSRPIMSAELYISGLDDSVSADEVASTIARVGACPVAAVK